MYTYFQTRCARSSFDDHKSIEIITAAIYTHIMNLRLKEQTQVFREHFKTNIIYPDSYNRGGVLYHGSKHI